MVVSLRQQQLLLPQAETLMELQPREGGHVAALFARGHFPQNRIESAQFEIARSAYDDQTKDQGVVFERAMTREELMREVQAQMANTQQQNQQQSQQNPQAQIAERVANPQNIGMASVVERQQSFWQDFVRGRNDSVRQQQPQLEVRRSGNNTRQTPIADALRQQSRSNRGSSRSSGSMVELILLERASRPRSFRRQLQSFADYVHTRPEQVGGMTRSLHGQN